MKRSVPCLAFRGIGSAILLSAPLQLGMVEPCYGQARPASIDSASVNEAVPQALRAAPDEILSPRARAEPVTGLERVPRLVASDPRVVMSTTPSFQVQDASARQVRTDVDRAGRGQGRQQGNPSANSSRAGSAIGGALGNSASAANEMVATPIVTIPSAYSAVPARPPKRMPARGATWGNFWTRPDVVRIAPLAVIFALFCAGLVVALRRERRQRLRIGASIAASANAIRLSSGEWAPRMRALEEGDSLPADLKPLPRNSASYSAQPNAYDRGAPSSPAVPGQLAPRRLIHALAGLNAELGEGAVSPPMPEDGSKSV